MYTTVLQFLSKLFPHPRAADAGFASHGRNEMAGANESASAMMHREVFFLLH